MTKRILLILLCISFSACTPTTSNEPPKIDLTGSKIIDLSHAFESQTIYWPTEDGFKFEKGPDGYTPQGFYYAANKFAAPEHGGTHIDAPKHFAINSHTLDQIPVEQLIGNGILVDVTKQSGANRDYEVTVGDFNAWESQHGQIPNGAIVLLRTGFAKNWPDRVKYMGTDERGAGAVPKLHFPGLHPDAARWLSTILETKRDRGSAVVLSSHRLHDLAGFCDNYLFLLPRDARIIRAHEIAPTGVVTAAQLADVFDKLRGGAAAIRAVS